MLDMKKALINASLEILPSFGITPMYLKESENEVLASANSVNILIGLTSGLRGNVVLGFKKSTALSVAASMMDTPVAEELDEIRENALAEFANLILGYATTKLNSESAIQFTPPTIVTGTLLFLLISRVKAYVLTFQLNDDTYEICFSVE